MMAAGSQFAPIEHKCLNHHNETGTDFGLGGKGAHTAYG